MLPGMMLAGLYVVYVVGRAPRTRRWRRSCRRTRPTSRSARSPAISYLFFPLTLLILAVLGAIFGFATPTEAAAAGAWAPSCSPPPTAR